MSDLVHTFSSDTETLMHAAGASAVARANLYCRLAASRHDKRQAVPETPYTVPDAPTRKLMAQLVWEEALETVNALGFEVYADPNDILPLARSGGIFRERPKPVDLTDIIDGSCDLSFVANGVMVGCGVPDVPHMTAVCQANMAKFPMGVATINPQTGKYQKPPGWKAPDHTAVMKDVLSLLPKNGCAGCGRPLGPNDTCQSCIEASV